MGMFDSVLFACPKPECDERIEAQSKAGECELRNYSPGEVPMVIAGDLHGEIWHCKCGTVVKIVALAGPNVAMTAVREHEPGDEE